MNVNLQLECLERRDMLHSNPVLDGEHAVVMDLVRTVDASTTAIRSGDWDAPATWDHGVPGPGARVWVPQSFTVTVDSVQAETLQWVRVDGGLNFSTTVSTGLTFDTMINTDTGTVTIGSATSPILPHVSATLTISPVGSLDALQLGRGLISHGTVSIYGATKTPFVAIGGAVAGSASVVLLTTTSTGWATGDRIVITGTNPNGQEDEERTIQAISGQTVTLNQALAYSHTAPSGFGLYAANLTRNVSILSSSASVQSLRGHVMFMHSPNVSVNYAAFEGLGRTDKSRRLDGNPGTMLDNLGRLIVSYGTNVPARYPVHVHRSGFSGPPVEFVGCVGMGSPGWMFVNHSSNVTFADNVAVRAFGAAFVSEVGDEIGTFTHNLAIHTPGSGESERSRKAIQDWGHSGHGFWMQSLGVELRDNISTGSAMAAFVAFGQPVIEAGLPFPMFATANLYDPSIAPGLTEITCGEVPIRWFDNKAYGSPKALEFWNVSGRKRFYARGVVDGFRSYQTKVGFEINYSGFTDFRDFDLRGPTGSLVNTDYGLGGNSLGSLTFDNFDVRGWFHGILVPPTDTSNVQPLIIRNGTLSNRINVLIPPNADAVIRRIDISNLTYVRSSASDRGVVVQTVGLGPRLFDPALYGVMTYNGRRLYATNQASSYVPVTKAATGIPAAWFGLTNAQLWSQFGVAVGGRVAPSDATTDSWVQGLIGEVVP